MNSSVALLIDGKRQAASLREQVSGQVHTLSAKGVHLTLAVILVGDDPASAVYVRTKLAQTAEAGLRSACYRLSGSVEEDEVVSLIETLNADPAIDGVLVQLPLPGHIDPVRIMSTIAPNKDVDGFTAFNAGALATGVPGLVPCTPMGCLKLIKSVRQDLTGLDAVMLGHSNIVGKPMAQLLLAEGCTVTVAHKATVNLPDICRRADLLVIAVGRPNLVRGSWIKEGAIVIDVGINRIDRGGRSVLVGDVAFDEAKWRAAAITPVPGGVGPMTVACLLHNTLIAGSRRRGLTTLSPQPSPPRLQQLDLVP